jgi:hypothetical protein
MSGAELRAYHRSPGVFLNPPRDDGDVEARVDELLDERDREHDYGYGHLPGRSPGCTLPSREAYRDAVRAQLAGARASIIPDGCGTREAQHRIRLAAPWAYIEDPAVDAETNRARREMAARIEALEVIRG